MNKASTRASKKYQEKIGLAPRTYKIKSDIADTFKESCKANGESQASVITRLMQSYINGLHPSNVCPYMENHITEYHTTQKKPPSAAKKANEERRNQVRDLLLQHPEKSNQEIVRIGGGTFAKDTVRRVREALIKSGEINT